MTDRTALAEFHALKQAFAEDGPPNTPPRPGPRWTRWNPGIGAAKPTNPKQACGERKAPITTVPAQVLTEVGLAMLEGARKYGAYNYRAAGVRASTYVDAVWRHLFLQWWDQGEDLDEDSGLSHVTKAIACLVVLRDSMLQKQMTDDRPPRTLEGRVEYFNSAAAGIIDRVRPNAPAEAFTEANRPEWASLLDGGAK